MPKISTVGLFSCDKFEETPKQKVIDLSKLKKNTLNKCISADLGARLRVFRILPRRYKMPNAYKQITAISFVYIVFQKNAFHVLSEILYLKAYLTHRIVFATIELSNRNLVITN